MRHLEVMNYLVVALIIGACGSDAPAGTDAAEPLITPSEIDDLYQSTNELQEAHCLCFDDTEECRTDRIVTDADIECVLEAASEHAGVEEYLDCVAVRWDRQGIDCFEAWACTDEADSPFTCFELPAADCDYSIASEYLEACLPEG